MSLPKELSDSLYQPFFSQIVKVFKLFKHVYETDGNEKEVFRAWEQLRVTGDKGEKLKSERDGDRNMG